MHEHDDNDEVQHEEQEHDHTEQHEQDELKHEDEVVEMLEAINLTDEMVVELMDTEVDEDGGEVTEVYEMVVEMMINEDDDEADMLLAQLLMQH